MHSTPIQAVLFDLDGTLVDNMRFHIHAWIEIARELGRVLTAEEVLRDFSGRRNDEILPRLLGRSLAPDELDALAARKEARYRALFAPHLCLLDGTAELLDALRERGVLRAIATAAPPANRAFVLDGLDLWSRIDVVVGGEEVARGKPSPDIFLEAAQRLGVPPERALVVEDAVLGVRAGRAAGMQVLGITTSEPGDALIAAGAVAVAPDFRALPPEIVRLLGG